MAMSLPLKNIDKYIEEIIRLLEDTVGLTLENGTPSGGDYELILFTFEEFNYSSFDLINIIENLEEYYEIHIGKKFTLEDTLEDLINYVSLLKG